MHALFPGQTGILGYNNPMTDSIESKRQEFFTDLVKAQGEMQSVSKDSSNPHFKSKYASLAAVLDEIRPALNRNRLALMQPSTFKKSEDGLSTILCTNTIISHVNGFSLEFQSEMIIKASPSPQEQGSAMSYNRRYGLMSLFAIPADDDDGNEASNKSSDAEVLRVWTNAINAADAKKLSDLKRQLANASSLSEQVKSQLSSLIASKEQK